MQRIDSYNLPISHYLHSIEDTEMASERDRVDAFAKKHFEIIAANVEHLDQADVICLGETHTEDSHRKNNGALIDMLSQKGDTVLVETEERRPMWDDQTQYVKNQVELDGWDRRDPSTNTGVAKLFTSVALDIISDIFLILGIIALFLFSPMAAYVLLPMGFVLGIAGMVLAKQGVQAVFDDIPERNRSLCERIDEAALSRKRVFAIAGSAHLSPVSASNYNFFEKALIDFKPQDEAFQETLASLQKHKFAILVPKEN